MKILHITPKTDGYEVVVLLANRVSPTNHMSVIEKDGEQFITGGMLITDTPKIREILDSMPIDEQYEFIKDFKITPFAKMYFEKD